MVLKESTQLEYRMGLWALPIVPDMVLPQLSVHGRLSLPLPHSPDPRLDPKDDLVLGPWDSLPLTPFERLLFLTVTVPVKFEIYIVTPRNCGFVVPKTSSGVLHPTIRWHS